MLPEIAIIASGLVLRALASPADNSLSLRDGPSDVQASRRAVSLQRRDLEKNFDLTWSAQDETLFSGDWEITDGVTSSLSFECVDCSTWGALNTTVTLPDSIGDVFEDLEDLNIFNDIELEVVFTGVGAYIDLGVEAGLDGTVKIPLFKSQTPLGIATDEFSIGIVFTVDLVLGATANVSFEGGFSVDIPTGSTFTMPLDLSKDNIADFTGASSELLPLSVDIPADVEVALRFGIQAGVEFTGSSLLEATALVGGFVNIPDITIGAEYTTNETCLPAFAGFNINAGVYVDIGGEIGDLDLPEYDPSAVTTIFSATTSTCFGAATSTARAVSSCAAADQTITLGTTVTTTTYVTPTATTQSLVACAVSAINCPASLAQVVRVEATPTAAAAVASCGGADTITSAAASVTAGGGNAVTLSSLQTAVTESVGAGSDVTLVSKTVVGTAITSVRSTSTAAIISSSSSAFPTASTLSTKTGGAFSSFAGNSTVVLSTGAASTGKITGGGVFLTTGSAATSSVVVVASSATAAATGNVTGVLLATGSSATSSVVASSAGSVATLQPAGKVGCKKRRAQPDAESA